MSSKQMTEDEKASLDEKILVELRAAAIHLYAVQELVAQVEGDKYATVNEVLSNDDNYNGHDGEGTLIENALHYIDVLGRELYAETATPGPFIDGKFIWEVEKATKEQEERAYAEHFHMQELWRANWMNAKGPNLMAITEHLDTYLDELEQPTEDEEAAAAAV